MKNKINEKHLKNGVEFIDVDNAYIDECVEIGSGTKVFPGVCLFGNTKIGENCLLSVGAVLTDMTVEDGVEIKPYSVLESSIIKKNAKIGPFARIRPESEIGEDARIGNFVEVKKTKVEKGAKANHLTYLGDAVVGARTNIGCGTITCNYDGFQKFQTIFEEDVFVGSDSQFVAPVRIGKGATIGAGSTITKDVPAQSLALSRVEQKNIENYKRKKKGT
ncbi:MAG: DapH/DapD/GlmU-related protein [Pseudomonadota bacterium]